ncbi:MAG: DUF5337 family protein [Dinoroseobacter sp.]|nr:DUF5337 family protein [Dinoroseobacter sp.]
MTNKADQLALAKQARLAAIVIAVTGVVWLLAVSFGGQLGLPVRFVFLIDLAALAAFFFALVLLFRVWRARQTMGD